MANVIAVHTDSLVCESREKGAKMSWYMISKGWGGGYMESGLGYGNEAGSMEGSRWGEYNAEPDQKDG